MKPLITVYITNHNYGRFISKSIQSVLNQSFKKYELIIIDDGSTDNSIKVIQSYYKKNKNIIFVKQKKGDWWHLIILQLVWQKENI